MKHWREKWENMDCRETLEVVNWIFYGSLVLLAVSLIILYASGVFSTVMIVVGFLSVAGMISGIILAYLHLRCPHCGASLMLGGRIPTHIPNFCPECGEPL